LATNRIKYRPATAAACLLLAALAALFLASCGDSDQQAKTAAPQPFNLELMLMPGAEPGRAVAAVRFFSRALTQRDLDQRLLPADQRRKIEPFKVAAGSKLWVESMSFEVLTPQGKALQLKPGQGDKVKVLRQPSAKELILGPATMAQAVYLLTAPGELEAGGKLRALLKVDGKEIASPYRNIAPPPANPVQASLQKARVARWSDDARAMLQAGQELSASDPASAAGPWYQGLAQERMGDKAAALGSYKKAMDLWRQKAKGAKHAEPPLGLARRISRLERPAK